MGVMKMAKEFACNLNQAMHDFMNKTGWKGLDPEDIVKEFVRFAIENEEKKNVVFTELVFMKADIEQCLDDNRIPVTEVNVNKVMECADDMRNRVYSNGWLDMQEIIQELKNDGEFKYYTWG